MAPLLHFTDREEQQLNGQAVMGQLPAQVIRLLRPRVARQPCIRHGRQQIEIGIRPLGTSGARTKQAHLGARNRRLDLGRDRAQQWLIHHVGKAGGAG